MAVLYCVPRNLRSFSSVFSFAFAKAFWSSLFLELMLDDLLFL